MKKSIQSLSALEILDSRGRPTVQVSLALESGAHGTVSIPSGESTGRAEALELRDGDPSRYEGLGCLKAVEHVEGELRSRLCGRTFRDQAELDFELIQIDGTPRKSRLGANALLGVSLAFARSCAAEDSSELYEYFAQVVKRPRSSLRLPRPTINLFSGGMHAGGQVAIQDVLVIPVRVSTMSACLERVHSVYQAAARLAQDRFQARALTADEGGLAPPFPTAEAMLDLAVESIEAADLRPAKDVALAVDVASSHFFSGGTYNIDGRQLDREAMLDKLLGWLKAYPILSVEDGLAEDDWEAWPRFREAVAGRALVLGDDLLCTNPARIQRAIDAKAADALLLKVNQIGTLSEAAESLNLARSANWQVTVSARSGETEDHWLADLAVGWGGDQIKVGSITQSERLAKYNRLLSIEAETGFPVVDWPESD